MFLSVELSIICMGTLPYNILQYFLDKYFTFVRKPLLALKLLLLMKLIAKAN